jgi:hypothetical protein
MLRFAITAIISISCARGQAIRCPSLHRPQFLTLNPDQLPAGDALSLLGRRSAASGSGVVVFPAYRR